MWNVYPGGDRSSILGEKIWNTKLKPGIEKKKSPMQDAMKLKESNQLRATEEHLALKQRTIVIIEEEDITEVTGVNEFGTQLCSK